MIFLAAVNYGSFISSFCISHFALMTFSSRYSGVKDLTYRIAVLAGLVVSSLLFPIWLHRTMVLEISPLFAVVGMPIGMICAAYKVRPVRRPKQ